MRTDQHNLLTWVTGVSSAATIAMMIWLGTQFIGLRDQMIRWEPIPGFIKEHEQRLDEHDKRLDRHDAQMNANLKPQNH